MERSPGQRQPHLERWGSPRWLHRRRHARKVSTNAIAASETSLRLEDAVDGTTGSVLTDNEGTTVDEELLTFDLVGQRNPPQDEHRAVRPLTTHPLRDGGEMLLCPPRVAVLSFVQVRI